jgi:TPR repeat protein
MGKLFQHGYGFVEQDLIKAYLWYKVAEEQGYPPSTRYTKTSSGWACCNPLPELDSLVEQMSAEEKTEADRLMSMWDPSTEFCQLEGNEAAPAS